MQKKHIWIPVAAAFLLLPLASVKTDATAAPAAQFAQTVAVSAADEIHRQLNAFRAQNGLPALVRDPMLDRAASVRAAEIAQKFSHTRPDGSHWSTVSDRAFGENIARGHRTADKTMAAWMTSAGHRATMLRRSYGSVGIAAVKINGVMHWVQLFGK